MFLHQFMYTVLAISCTKLLFLLVDYLLPCLVRKHQVFSLLLQISAADGLPSVCIHKIPTGPINMYFSVMLYWLKNPTTIHPNFENNKYFIVLFPMDIFRDDCP